MHRETVRENLGAVYLSADRQARLLQHDCSEKHPDLKEELKHAGVL